MSNANEGCLQRLVRWVFRHRHKWTVRQKISLDKQTVYTLRKCVGCGATEIQDIYGRWNNLNTVNFSSLPLFEEWHRERFETSVDVANAIVTDSPVGESGGRSS